MNTSIGNFWSMSGSLGATPNAGRPPAGDEIDRGNPHEIGAIRSFVPLLGEIVWELPKADVANVQLSAHVARLSDGRQIGYVRVPHYTLSESAMSAFAKLIARFERSTAAMVFDQVNNPGGSVSQMYDILSSLTDRTLDLPLHQLSLNEDDADIAREIIAKAKRGAAVPINERPSADEVAYSRFVLSEIDAGRARLTNPVHLGGVKTIIPAKRHYTKPIVVLINELDFSAAEFLAAILQDNKRAILFGEQTAGAGGCVRQVTIPQNPLGVDYMTLTWTIALRTNGQRIEGIGVTPDVRYSLTAEDLQTGYEGYRHALLATFQRLGVISATL